MEEPRNPGAARPWTQQAPSTPILDSRYPLYPRLFDFDLVRTRTIPGIVAPFRQGSGVRVVAACTDGRGVITAKPYGTRPAGSEIVRLSYWSQGGSGGRGENVRGS